MFEWSKEKFDCNFINADTMKRFDAAEKTMWDGLSGYEKEHAPDGNLTADGVIAECSIIDTFFNDLFGEDAAGKMFTQEHDLGERVKAVKKLYLLREEQLKGHAKAVNDITRLVQRK